MGRLMTSESFLTPTGTTEILDGNATVLPANISSIRAFYPAILLLSMLSSGYASGRCFNTDKGLTIHGSEYRRLRHIGHRGCAMECRDDQSCLAYEWLESEKLCYLKARSLSGNLVKKDDALIGFCLDDDDEVRDRLRDHEAHGPVLVTFPNMNGEECKQACGFVTDAALYSWTPDDKENDEAVVGTCNCMETLRSITLDYNSFSGFLEPRKFETR